MAVVSNIEWKIESAVINALQQNSDLSGATIRRWKDNSADKGYPAVVVHCDGSIQPPEWAGRVGYDRAIVSIASMTNVRDDATGQTAADNLGAVRDSIRTDNFLKYLNQTAGLTVYDIEMGELSDSIDANKIRNRLLSIVCHATCSDTPDEASSESSSSSFNSSSSSSSQTSESSTSESSFNLSSSSPSSSQSSTSESTEGNIVYRDYLQAENGNYLEGEDGRYLQVEDALQVSSSSSSSTSSVNSSSSSSSLNSSSSSLTTLSSSSTSSDSSQSSSSSSTVAGNTSSTSESSTSSVTTSSETSISSSSTSSDSSESSSSSSTVAGNTSSTSESSTSSVTTSSETSLSSSSTSSADSSSSSSSEQFGGFQFQALDQYDSYLSAAYKFEETTGTRLDSKGDHDLTAVNTPGNTTGKDGTAADLLRASNHVFHTPHAAALTPTTGFAISFWIKPTTIPALSSSYVIRKDPSLYPFQIFISVSDIHYSIWQSNGVSVTDSTNPALVAGTWYHMVLVAWNGIVTLFHDGAHGSEHAYDGTIRATSTDKLFIGATDAGGSNGIDASIDELYLWKDIEFASTADRDAFATNLYNSGTGRFYNKETASSSSSSSRSESSSSSTSESSLTSMSSSSSSSQSDISSLSSSSTSSLSSSSTSSTSESSANTSSSSSSTSESSTSESSG